VNWNSPVDPIRHNEIRTSSEGTFLAVGSSVLLSVLLTVTCGCSPWWTGVDAMCSAFRIRSAVAAAGGSMA